MSPYTIVWSVVAAGQRDKIDPSVRRRIVAKVEQAASNPRRYATRLVGSPFYRLRVGDWRVILKINEDSVEILVIEVKHRRNAYR